jgi:tRNA 2-thiouridine synthesizing protein D
MKTLTLTLMDPPYETEATTTAFRLIDAALRKGHAVREPAWDPRRLHTLEVRMEH